jgi:hypothetical protein
MRKQITPLERCALLGHPWQQTACPGWFLCPSCGAVRAPGQVALSLPRGQRASHAARRAFTPARRPRMTWHGLSEQIAEQPHPADDERAPKRRGPLPVITQVTTLACTPMMLLRPRARCLVEHLRAGRQAMTWEARGRMRNHHDPGARPSCDDAP